LRTKENIHGLEHEFGFVPLFRVEGSAAMSPRLLALIEADPALAEIDAAALNVFFRIATFLDGETPFRRVKQDWPEPLLAKPVSLTREQAMDAYIDLFRQAIRRRCESDSIIGLSGGRDSRHILLELHRIGRLPSEAVTVTSPRRPEEITVAVELARRVGVRHRVIPVSPAGVIEAEIWKDRETNFASFQHGWLAPLARQRDGRAWWDGMAGDVLSAGEFLEEWNLSLFRKDRLDELADKIVGPGAVPEIIRRRNLPRDYVLQRVWTELRKHRDAPNPVASFFLWNRTRRDISSMTFVLLQPRGQTANVPFLDRDLWSLLAGLPGEMFVDHTFHTEVIARSFPEFADLPYSRIKLADPFRRRARKAAELLRHLWTDSVPTGRLRVTARTLAAVASNAPASTLDWTIPWVVYASQIARITGWRGCADASAPEDSA
jgi:asparagine synthase (glutamine-hydrolysing)